MRNVRTPNWFQDRHPRGGTIAKPLSSARTPDGSVNKETAADATSSRNTVDAPRIITLSISRERIRRRSKTTRIMQANRSAGTPTKVLGGSAPCPAEFLARRTPVRACMTRLWCDDQRRTPRVPPPRAAMVMLNLEIGHACSLRRSVLIVIP